MLSSPTYFERRRTVMFKTSIVHFFSCALHIVKVVSTSRKSTVWKFQTVSISEVFLNGAEFSHSMPKMSLNCLVHDKKPHMKGKMSWKDSLPLFKTSVRKILPRRAIKLALWCTLEKFWNQGLLWWPFLTFTTLEPQQLNRIYAFGVLIGLTFPQ